MDLILEPYLDRENRLPKSGRHIVAQYDDETIVVYQAYRSAIGHFAARHGYFGGEFSLNRMSWIKTSFLWMMYRSGWGLKPGQEVVLSVRMTRTAFEQILGQAILSTHDASLWPDPKDWKRDIAQSQVRLQWDPDRNSGGVPQQRRAIQLGLRREVLARYARSAPKEDNQGWVVCIEDLSEYVARQREHALNRKYELLTVPKENVYPVVDQEVARRIQLGRSDN